MQAVGIGKMGVGHAQLPGGRIHQGDEVFHRAGNMLGDGDRAVVA